MKSSREKKWACGRILCLCAAVLMGLCGLCACGAKEAASSEGGSSAESQTTELIDKYEGMCELMGINVSQEKRIVYEAGGDKLSGYTADLSLGCSGDIPEQDLAGIACEYVMNYMVTNGADIAECKVFLLSDTELIDKAVMRFADFSRSHADVSFEKSQKTYRVDRDLPKDLLLYTEITAEPCGFVPSGGGEKLQGVSVAQEISFLRDVTDDEREKMLREHIIREKEEMDDEESPRIEYRFSVYGRDGKKQEITMRQADGSGETWEKI